jgi:hypothetical protein
VITKKTVAKKTCHCDCNKKTVAKNTGKKMRVQKNQFKKNPMPLNCQIATRLVFA